jgi:shikimate dehydrogenase
VTQLLKDAASGRDTVLGGELMLLHQGARAFELWTGKPAPIEVMQAELDRIREHGLRQIEVDMGPGAGASDGGSAAAPSA